MIKNNPILIFLVTVIIVNVATANQEQQLPSQIRLGLHPDNQQLSGPVTVQFGLPIPPDIIVDPSALILMSETKNLPIDTKVLAYWPQTFKKNKIRALLITTQLTDFKQLPKHLILKFTDDSNLTVNEKTRKTITELPDVRKIWQPAINYLLYRQPEKLLEPSIYVTIPPEWLSRSLLKTISQPMFTDHQFRWFDQSALNFGKTAVNETQSGKLKLIDFHNNEPWMFDRVANLYHLYIRTGDFKWYKHAHLAAQFYAQHINQKGYMEINRKCDLKCSYPQGLWIDYLLTGDKHQKSVINRIERAGKRWFPRYSRGLNFFTERHQTYAFWALITAWEANPDDMQRQKSVVNFFDQTYAGIYHPPSGWTVVGCYQHQYQDHEGEGTNQPICSPWMSALLVEAVWKYFLLTGDTRALEVLSGFGDYLVDFGTYSIDSPNKIKRQPIWFPYYISGAEYTFQRSPSNDRHHSCDIAGMLARSVWAKSRLNLSVTATKHRLRALLDTCRDNLYAVSRANTIWPIGPYRKYNWEFGSTHDLSWLLQEQTRLLQ